MKLFKKIAMFTMAIALTFGVGGLVACGGNTDSTGSSTEQPAAVSAYKFKVVKTDGTAVAGVQVQLCKGTDFCAMPKMTGADGTVSYDFPNGNADEYDIHVWDATMSTEYNVGHPKTSANYDGAEIVITIAD